MAGACLSATLHGSLVRHLTLQKNGKLESQARVGIVLEPSA